MNAKATPGPCYICERHTNFVTGTRIRVCSLCAHRFDVVVSDFTKALWPTKAPVELPPEPITQPGWRHGMDSAVIVDELDEALAGWGASP